MRYFLTFSLLLLLCCPTAHAVDTASTAALVNGASITIVDFKSELNRVLRLKKTNEKLMDSTALALLKRESLETLIGRELLYQQSRQKGIKILPSAVEAEIAGLRRQYPSEDDYTSSLVKLGLSEDIIKSQVERGMAIQNLIESEFSSKTAVLENEARNYYDKHQQEYFQPAQIRLSHILVKFGTLVNNSEKSLARVKIENIHRRISQGENFALLARESDDSKSGTIGGDLGYFTAGQLGKNMEAAAFSLEIGQVSTIIEDRFGYHILKVTENQPAAAAPFETVREKISTQLQRERMLAEITPYLKRLRDAARVEIHLTEK